MMAMALAAFSLATRPVAMVLPTEKKTPWASPVRMRATIRLSYPGACQASRLPTVKRAISPTSSHLRGSLPVSAVSTGAPMATPRA